MAEASPVKALLLALLATAPLAAVDVMPLAIESDLEGDFAQGSTLPGREAPAALPEPVAVTFKWDGDENLTRVVVGPACSDKGMRAPAWIVTYDLQDHVQVAYRGVAFRDKNGLLHIDSRHAIITGPRSAEWSPDSFAINEDGTVQTIDDENRANGGTVTETVKAKDSTFRRLLTIAIAIVRGTS
jgi:hypothetical protein